MTTRIRDIVGPTDGARRRRLVAGVDVGGTKTAAILVDDEDRVLARSEAMTTPDRLAEQIVELVEKALTGAGATTVDLDVVGVAAPGRVDRAAGTVHLAVNLGGRDIAVGAYVAERLATRAVIEHDARAAALWLHGDGDPRRSLAYVSIGTGIAAGIVLGDRPLEGANGMAGEIGHLVAAADGPRCACGLRGCLEAVAAGPAIARRAREARDGHTGRLGADSTTEDVFRASAAGDPIAAAIVDDVAGYLARAIRGLVLAFGLDRVVIGGGVARAGDALLDPLLAAIERERAASLLVREVVRPGLITILPPDHEAGAWGAVTAARRAPDVVVPIAGGGAPLPIDGQLSVSPVAGTGRRPSDGKS